MNGQKGTPPKTRRAPTKHHPHTHVILFMHSELAEYVIVGQFVVGYFSLQKVVESEVGGDLAEGTVRWGVDT